MTLSRIMELVSQAENEGITLAEMISRTMSSEQIDSAEAELAEELSHNYGNIEEFMSDVEVPSLDEIESLSEDLLTDLA